MLSPHSSEGDTSLFVGLYVVLMSSQHAQFGQSEGFSMGELS